MNTRRWGLGLAMSVLGGGCGGDDPPVNDYGHYASTSTAVCGNAVKERGEVCDGAALDGASCASLGMGSGTLRCRADCTAYDATACTDYCAQDCGGRQCGPDPVCHLSCGSCSVGICTSAGRCELPDPDAPTILTLGTNVTTLSEGESITLTAMVTDPQGVADLVGGAVTDPINGATYGAFSSTGSAGSYTLTLSWYALNQARRIDFTGVQLRELVAEFVDTAGHRAAQPVSVTLTCPVPTGEGELAVCSNGSCGVGCVAGMNRCGYGCCAGTCCDNSACVDTSSDPSHCGGCWRACDWPYGGSASCVGGDCRAECPAGQTACDGYCTDMASDNWNCGACGRVCDSDYYGTSTCVAGECELTCIDDAELCDGVCVDTAWDHFNCGSCGHACGDYTDAYYACSYGSCATTPTCKGGYYACGSVCCSWATHPTGACAWQGGGWLGCG